MIYPDVLRKIKDLENTLVSERVEHLYVFRPDGGQLVHNVGHSVGAELLASELPRLRDCIATHNHPGKYGTSFSANDVRLAVTGDFLQFRAVGMDRVWHPGKFYRYVLDRPVIGWPDGGKVSDYLDFVWDDTKKFLQNRVFYCEVAADRATCILNHLCLKRFSKRFGVAYARYIGVLI